MKRRTLLAQIGAVTAGGALAGCISDGGSTDGGGGGGGETTDDGQNDGNGQATATETATATATPTRTPTETATPTETRIGEATVTESSGSCGSGNEASVTFQSGSIGIEGTIQASDPCHVAQIGDVTYDSDGGALTVTITVEEEGDMCTQCIGGITYEATVGVEGSPPGSVRVVHQSMDESRDVTTARP